jgi:tripeptide aminopeptidase
MTLSPNKNRIAATFIRLCETDSPSRKEGRMAALLSAIFSELKADAIWADESKSKTGSETGNLFVRFNGSDQRRTPLFFSCHMDTVEPGVGVKVQRDGDRFTSSSDTILGSDDKSGIAAVIELMTLLSENSIPHGPIELIFTTCEEIGLLGAKHLDPKDLKSHFGYALDSTGIDRIITGAPAANRFKIHIHGIAAHAGLNPEQGISAFCIAAKAIAGLKLGRIDSQSTANLGLMQGGVATNIVPPLLTLEGEVRSHSPEKLADYTDRLIAAFQKTVDTWPIPDGSEGAAPRLDFEIHPEYPAMALKDTDPVVTRVKKAGIAAGKQLEFIIAGGGSDANIFNSYGLPTVIVATGMNNVHTTQEYLDLKDIVSLTELLYAIVIADD